ncbi:hypothetical protein Mapa_018084 [Marchantia paleacea]|nr:hypothetical protein Mapa_018084 [Marchantia paleacea]
MWGGKRRLYAATKFILYTAAGSLFILIGGLIMAFYNSNESTFDFQLLINKTYPLELEIIVYLSFLIAYAVKLPIIPFHTWLPDTHGEAHYSTSIQIVYAALTSLSQRNLKRRIAYSSVSHMGFVLIGIGSITNLGLNGAILQMISHGLIGASFFFLAGISYDRTRTLVLDQMGGIGTSMPKIFTLFSSCSMASLALPGMSGFIAELMIFLGVIDNPNYSFLFKIIIIIIQGIGIILTPIYLLSMLRQMFYGYKFSNTLTPYLMDAGPREIFILICLFFPIIGIGIYPNFVLSIWNSKVNFILSNNFF